MSLDVAIQAVYTPLMNEKLKNNIFALRTAKGWSQQRLADEISKDGGSIIGKDQVSKHERADRPLNLSWIVRYAKALKCRPEDIISSSPLKQKTADHSELGVKSKLSNTAVDDDNAHSHIDRPLLAEAIAAVKQVMEEQKLLLTPDQFAVAVEKTYSEAEKFAEKPTKSTASMAIKLLDKGREDGRELET